MAAFISSTWQGTSTRIPDEGIKLTEEMSTEIIQKVLPLATPLTRFEAKLLLNDPTRSLSDLARMELRSLVTGYVRQSGAGR